jgi:hypothetical protein
MKVGDYIYCKKDFYNLNQDDDVHEHKLSKYPEHAFKLGQKYKIFAIDQYNKYYIVEIDDVYIEYFIMESDYNKIDSQYSLFNFNEYFCESIKELRKFKLNKLK